MLTDSRATWQSQRYHRNYLFKEAYQLYKSAHVASSGFSIRAFIYRAFDIDHHLKASRLHRCHQYSTTMPASCNFLKLGML
ncbi:hypothetical protein RRG08_056728 [Elysia crispata]|uniref:Uncharacterized protein n=1 Tax=Elysia crispata TaxID=231223 RepID=A0AAE1B753_9GAST|nr:hypothetical protein RRG08_056728 [Elysia crispata]